MTVKELIEELKKYPEDLDVVTVDYEYGASIIDGAYIDNHNITKNGKIERNFKVLVIS